MKQKIETVGNRRKLIAIIIRSGAPPLGATFFSPKNAPFQVGNIVKKAGETIKAHIHEEPVKTVRVTQEVLYIEKGRLLVTLYSSKGKVVYKGTLASGDKIFLASGGHGFEVLEDTVIFEVKQGPYPGYEKAKKYLNK
jgi:hypothetical protein